MEFNYMTLVMNWLNIAIIVAIIIGIIKCIKEVKKFINRNKQIDKKLDTILEELEKRKNWEGYFLCVYPGIRSWRWSSLRY